MCDNCGIPGHLSHDYTTPRIGKRQDIVCFNYGIKGHISRDCYHRDQVNTGLAAPVNQGHVNVIIPRRARFDATEQRNLEGTLTLYNSRVPILFDIGATNSFIAHRVV